MSQTEKTPGQVAAREFYRGHGIADYAYNSDTSANWDRAAAAVIAYHEEGKADEIAELEAQLAERRVVAPDLSLEDMDHGANESYRLGQKAGYTLAASRVRAINPATEMVVAREELAALRCLDDAVTINGDGMSTEALGVDWEVARSAKRRLSDIRAAKGGEA